MQRGQKIIASLRYFFRSTPMFSVEAAVTSGHDVMMPRKLLPFLVPALFFGYLISTYKMKSAKR